MIFMAGSGETKGEQARRADEAAGEKKTPSAFSQPQALPLG